ncbi:hypothetical protein [Gluconobacter sphaericus]|uniref:hypothetical protein n=1 Tax=Gluconobacter sphaericus TaxID=574987 RepID=UPI00312BB2C3
MVEFLDFMNTINRAQSRNEIGDGALAIDQYGAFLRGAPHPEGVQHFGFLLRGARTT